ncbi:MAG: four helix bundle protein [Anaerolineae bacterium]|nr:four helix bundle protein [Anaerolineae bacterium]
MRDFKTLKVWQKAHQFTLDVYAISASFPSEEKYGLTSQLRRATSSIPTNIAEGCGRMGDAELARFLSIAMGSASEVEYQLLLCHDLGILSKTDYARLEPALVEIKRMLNGFIQTLKAKN